MITFNEFINQQPPQVANNNQQPIAQSTQQPAQGNQQPQQATQNQQPNNLNSTQKRFPQMADQALDGSLNAIQTIINNYRNNIEDPNQKMAYDQGLTDMFNKVKNQKTRIAKANTSTYNMIGSMSQGKTFAQPKRYVPTAGQNVAPAANQPANNNQNPQPAQQATNK